MLNPIFSINHMRHMIPMFYDVGHKVRAPTLQPPRGALYVTVAHPIPLSFPRQRAFWATLLTHLSLPCSSALPSRFAFGARPRR